MSENGKGDKNLHARTQIPPEEMQKHWDVVFARCPRCGEQRTDAAELKDGVWVRFHLRCLEED